MGLTPEKLLNGVYLTGASPPFKPGAFFIAAELDIPVIPLVTVFSPGPHKLRSFWGRSRPREKLVVLDAVYPGAFIRWQADGTVSSESIREFVEEVRGIMQREIEKRPGRSAFFRGRMKRIQGINDKNYGPCGNGLLCPPGC
jgi:1-acyl-sn-glycerol-3-phosphate acyltransferase